MAHFAELNESNIVQRVVVIADADCLDGDNNESESVGIAFCVALFGGGTWKQTSYNNNIRKQYAGIDFTYDVAKDKYIAIKPFASWSLNADDDWESPLGVMPSADNKAYTWDESAYQADNSTGWVESDVE